jgi:hypothetical protein
MYASKTVTRKRIVSYNVGYIAKDGKVLPNRAMQFVLAELEKAGYEVGHPTENRRGEIRYKGTGRKMIVGRFGLLDLTLSDNNPPSGPLERLMDALVEHIESKGEPLHSENSSQTLVRCVNMVFPKYFPTSFYEERLVTDRFGRGLAFLARPLKNNRHVDYAIKTYGRLARKHGFDILLVDAPKPDCYQPLQEGKMSRLETFDVTKLEQQTWKDNQHLAIGDMSMESDYRFFQFTKMLIDTLHLESKTRVGLNPILLDWRDNLSKRDVYMI